MGGWENSLIVRMAAILGAASVVMHLLMSYGSDVLAFVAWAKGFAGELTRIIG